MLTANRDTNGTEQRMGFVGDDIRIGNRLRLRDDALLKTLTTSSFAWPADVRIACLPELHRW